MPISLIDKIKQKNGGTFPLVDDTDQYGGYRAVADVAARDAIPDEHRKAGMLVYTVAEAKAWSLGEGLTNDDWTQFAGPPSLGGDVFGPASNAKVIKINGGSVPAATGMTVGHVIYAGSPTGYSRGPLPIDNANAVSGLLPAANQAAQSMGGDCSGTTATCTVGKVNGVSYPSGATTVGTIPRVTAANTVAYGALDLANANAVTGTLPGSKVSPNFGSQPIATTSTGSFGGDVNVDGTFSIGGKGNGVWFERFGLGQMTSNDRQVVNTPSSLTRTTREELVTEVTTTDDNGYDFGANVPDGGVSVFHVRVTAVKSDNSADDSWVGVIKIRRSGSTMTESGKTITRIGSTSWTVDIGNFSTIGIVKVRCTGAAATTIRWSCEISRLTTMAA